MEENTITLASLFDFSDAALRSQISEGVSATSLAVQLAAKKLDFSRESIANEIANKIASLCDVDIIKLLAGAWNKEREIEEYMDKGHQSPGESAFVSLLEHEVKSTWPLVVEIEVRPLSYKINLDVTIVLSLKGVKLKIEDGELTELISGSIGGKITISVESAGIWKQECKPIDLMPVRLKRQATADQTQRQRVAG
jgi:hypothetical protein